MSLEDLFGPGAGDDPGDDGRPAKEPRQPKQPREPKPPKPPREPKPTKPPKPPRERRAARQPEARTTPVPTPAAPAGAATSAPPPGPPAAPPTEERSRTPLILGIVAGVLFVAVVVALAFALTRGSSSDATPVAPPTSEAPTAQPTPTPTKTPARVPVSLEFAATGFSLVDDTGAPVFRYAWTDDAATAVTALSKAFGAEPTQRVEPGDGSHYPDYTVYQWDGFMLFDMIESAGGTPRDQYPQPSYTLFSRNRVGGIEIVAERGLTIGMSVDAVRALGPDAEIPRGNVGAIRFVFDRSRTNAAGAPQPRSTMSGAVRGRAVK
ncbi:hypothetical protein [Microbacterium sp. MMO-79]|uniref:hypothetical protein n=1 Tax=Microbacterium sp. MMO-79 TaxID=3081285 RepID=UPI0030184682